jgi:hypothetical protein
MKMHVPHVIGPTVASRARNANVEWIVVTEDIWHALLTTNTAHVGAF